MSVALGRIAAISMLLSLLLIGSGTALAQTAASAAEQRVFVRTIVTDPSELLSDEEIHSVTRRYEGRSLSIAELQAIIDEINALYDAKGHPLSQAVLPPQQVVDGSIHIRLVEVRVGEVRVEGNQHTKDTFFTRRITLSPGELFNFIELEEFIIRFNAANDVQVRAALQAGEEFGTTDYVLTAFEPNNTEWRYAVDNAGRTETGELQGHVSWMNRSLRGVRDRLALSFVGSAGAQSWSAAYSFPAGTRGARLELSVAGGKTRVIAGAAKDLGITGRASDWTLRYAWAPSLSQSRRIDVDAAIRSRASDTFFSGVKLLFERVDTATLTVSRQEAGDGASLSVRRALTVGWLDQGYPFYKLRFDRNLQRALGRGSFSFRTSLQLEGGGTRPGGEKFSVAGDQEGTVVEGSNGGFSLGAEWHVPVTPSFAPYVFVDLGSFFTGGFDPSTFTVSRPAISLGVGANTTFGAYIGASVSARYLLSTTANGSNPGPGKIFAQLYLTW